MAEGLHVQCVMQLVSIPQQHLDEDRPRHAQAFFVRDKDVNRMQKHVFVFLFLIN